MSASLRPAGGRAASSLPTFTTSAGREARGGSSTGVPRRGNRTGAAVVVVTADPGGWASGSLVLAQAAARASRVSVAEAARQRRRRPAACASQLMQDLDAIGQGRVGDEGLGDRLGQRVG